MNLNDAEAMCSKKGEIVFYDEPIDLFGIIGIRISSIQNDLSVSTIISSSRSAPKLSSHMNSRKHFKRSTNG